MFLQKNFINIRFLFFLLALVILPIWTTAQEETKNDELEGSIHHTQQKIKELLETNPEQIFASIIVSIGLAFLAIWIVTLVLKKMRKGIQFASGRWNALSVVAGLFLYFMVQTLALLIYSYLDKSQQYPEGQFIAGIFAYIFGTIAIAGFIYLLHAPDKVDKRILGLQNFTLRRGALAILGYISFVPIYLAAIWLSHLLFVWLNLPADTQRISEEILTASGLKMCLGIILATVIAPLCEEFLFRVFLYTGIRNQFGVPTAVIASSLIFALVHVVWLGFLPILALGILLALLYENSQSLWVPVIAHALHNTLTLFYLLFVIGS